ncbi:MAG: hypothetical protein WC783_01085 [Candidatus Paceibacterota bacterium]
MINPLGKYNLTEVKATIGYFDAIKQNQSKSVRGDLVGYNGFSALNTRYVPPEILQAPRNIMVSTPFWTKFAYDINWDPTPDLRILGYSIYRSFRDTGTYTRLNNYVIQTTQFRDQTRDIHVEYEDLKDQLPLAMNGNGEYILRTAHSPIVDSNSMNKTTDSLDAVQLYINGSSASIRRLYGQSGEMLLRTTAYYDAKNFVLIRPTIPTASDDVRVSYWYNENKVDPILDQRAMYKVTSIAYDEEQGDLIETDPQYLTSTAISGEPMDWIWAEAVRRNAWIINISGERFLAFARKQAGEICSCVFEDYGNMQPSSICPTCYGTGFIGGYEDPLPIVVVVPASEKEIMYDERGKAIVHVNQMWMAPRPILNQEDILLRHDGSLHMIGPVKRVSVRGNIYLQQSFQIEEIQRDHPVYKMLNKTSLDNYRGLQVMDGNMPPRTSSAEFNLIANKIPVTISDVKGRTMRFPTIVY